MLNYRNSINSDKRMNGGGFHFAFLPFLFSHWLGIEFMAAYATLLGFFLLVFLSLKMRIPDDLVLKVGIFIVPIFFLTNIASNAGVDNEYFFIYLYQFLSIYFLTAFIVLFGRCPDKKIVLLARLIFYIAFLSIFFEFCGVNFIGIPKEHFPATRYSFSYFEGFNGWHRPFGLTGQASVNGGILLFSYLLLLELNICKLKHFIMLLVGVFLTISGQAIISTIIILMLLHIKKYKTISVKASLTFLGFGLLLIVMNANIFQKLSMDYVIYVLIANSDIKTIADLNSFQLMFGAMGMVIGHSEVFFVESVLRYGLVFTTLFWGFVWLVVREAALPTIWFIACILTSLHYPTVYFIESQLIIGLLYCYTSNRQLNYSIV